MQIQPAPPQQPIRILIADDHSVVLKGMISIISSSPHCEVVAKALSGLEAVELYKIHRPDIAIIDLKMPQLSGLEVIERIKNIDENAKIIVLSAYNAEELIYQAVQLGVLAYVLKESLMDSLIEVIYTVSSGKQALSDEIVTTYAMRATKLTLSQREIEILGLVARGSSNAQISSSLHITEGTVKVHIHNILKKLSVPDRTMAVVEAVRRGLIEL